MGREVFCQLRRFSTDDQGTFGLLHLIQEWFGCYTIELPWKDNEPFRSCIPAGTYPFVPYESSQFGDTYLVQDVSDRWGILLHAGNVAGDVTEGYRTHSEGCLMVGKRKGRLWGQKAVLLSRPTIRRLKESLDGREGKIEIIDDWR